MPELPISYRVEPEGDAELEIAEGGVLPSRWAMRKVLPFLRGLSSVVWPTIMPFSADQ